LGDGIALAELSGRVTLLNPALMDLSGHTVDSLNRAEGLRSLYQDPGPIDLALELAAKGQSWSGLLRLTGPAGPAEQVRVTTHPLRDREGEVSALAAAHREIDRRMMVLEALRESEERFRKLADVSPYPVLIVSPDGGVVYVSSKFSQAFGYTREELPTRQVVREKLFPDPEYRTRILAEVSAWESSHRPEVREWERRLTCKDGTVRDVISHGIAISGGDTYIILQDITERKRAEEERRKLESQLRQAQKMEAVGTLAGGLAHDFNNLLQVIYGSTQLMQDQVKAGQPGHEDLIRIMSATERAAELVKQLLAFSRKAESRLQPVDLNQLVGQAGRMLSRVIPKMIDFELHLGQGLETILADTNQIQQVLMNLGINARDAMPEGGRIIIETENVILSQEYARQRVEVTPGRYVLLTLSDTGRGMDRETLEHIFEPFYTTKETGQGTGLGLAMVYGIIKNHGGHIACYSEPGQGTVFKIYLPAAEGAALGPQDRKNGDSVGGRETILVVDDEEPLRDIAVKLLAGHGYRVLTAPDGQAALRVFQDPQNAVDLVILDLNMPGMDGARCLAELLKLAPRLKVIMASGYSINGHGQRMLQAGAADYISKPYASQELLAKIRTVLDTG